MTSDKTFLDTNIFVYAFDRSAPKKRQLARELISESIRLRSGVISTQVLQELYVVGTRKLGILPEILKTAMESLKPLQMVIMTPQLIFRSIDTQIRWQISFWDAMILQAANHAQCTLLYTEDLTHGHQYGSVKAINPFQS